MSTIAQLTDRILALLGLDVDLSISLERDPFNRITEDLYVGARPDRDLVPKLEEVGIGHVVSCLDEDDRTRVAFLKEKFQHLFIPMRDGIHEDIASALPAFFDFVQTAERRPDRAKVLVHCEVGVSRSATLAAALMMQRTRRGFFEVYLDLRAQRPEVLPNIGFASQLQRLELEMDLRTRDDPNISSLARYLREVCRVPADLETLQTALHHHDYDALSAIQSIFGDEIPRVIQGVRL